MAKILAIDVGAYSIKLATLESVRKNIQSAHFEELPHKESPRESLAAALHHSFGSKITGIDQVFFSLPGTSIATHQLSFPFADHKRIDATLGFEIETVSAMDITDVAFDYQLIINPEQKNRLLVGIALRKELMDWIGYLTGLSVEPRWIAHPALQLASLVSLSTRRKNQPLPKNFAIVDIGHERCCFASINAHSSCDTARIFPGGGKEITNALSRAFNISEQEAATWKEKHGTLMPSHHPPAAHKAAELMQQALLPVERELRILLKMRESQGQEPIEHLYLTGGTSQLQGISAYLSKSLSVPVELLSLTGFKETLPPSAGQVTSLLSSYQSTTPRARRFNFRQKDLAYKSELDFLKDKFPTLSVFVLCAAVLFMAGGVTRNIFLKANEQRIDNELCALTTRVLGQCERDYVRAESLLSGSPNPAPALSQPSAADFLAHLVQHIANQFDIQFEQILIQPERISLKSKAAQKLDIYTLKTALEAIPCIDEIKEGKVENSRDGLTKNFPLDIKLSCPPPSGS